jgi:hypothetical protein
VGPIDEDALTQIKLLDHSTAHIGILSVYSYVPRSQRHLA